MTDSLGRVVLPWLQASGPYQAAAGRRSTGALPLADRVRGINKPAVLRDTATKGAVEVLKQLVLARWNPEIGLLNLEVRLRCCHN